MKVLHADLTEDRVFLRRFAREADALSALQHPHIVRFYGLEQDDGLTFILMGYVEGTTLRKQVFDLHLSYTMNCNGLLNKCRILCHNNNISLSA